MKTKAKILIAEDEISLATILKESLETRDFEVILCPNGEIALSKFNSEQPDLLVLDIMMPKKDGLTVAKEVRSHNKHIPIIFLTSKSQTKDVIEGFEHGGNDYLKKPFSIEELIVRISALLNRSEIKQSNSNLTIGAYTFNYTKQKISFNTTETHLTHREAELLFHLSEKRNEILDRSWILKKIWGDDDFFNSRSMDVFISKLRKKLSKDKNVEILNVRGYGYKLIC